MLPKSLVRPDALVLNGSFSTNTLISCAKTLIRAAMVLDGTGRSHAPGAVLLEGSEVLGVGSPQDIGELSGVEEINRREAVLIPGLVNVHCHLDLSHIGPIPYTGDFVSWVDLVRDRRGVSADLVREAVQRGIELSLAGGSVLVGDIAGVGSFAAFEAMRDSRLRGVSYIELFGQGPPARQAAALDVIRKVEKTAYETNRVRLGLQPHAPYSCARPIYQAAIDARRKLAAQGRDLPLATHLAETPEELEFARCPQGSALAGLLVARGVWHDAIERYGSHPIDALADLFSSSPFVAAHLNYIEDHHLDLLSQWPVTVAYCPRASTYFGHHMQADSPGSGHRYREMLEAGVNVALGTDSILCLDTPNRISVLDEMRFLYLRDATDPMTLLRMATIQGAKALGFDPSIVTFDKGPIAGIVALPFDPSSGGDLFEETLTRRDAPEWVLAP